MRKEFIITADGSHTIYLPEIDEHYHSVHGAIQESLHIYIGAGLLQSSKTELNILEIGFGTGLNAYLTYCSTQESQQKINYYSLEKYPLNEQEYMTLNFPENIYPEHAPILKQMHTSAWNIPVSLSPEFTLRKIEADLIHFSFETEPQFDLVYYDAFAPGKQPEMWTDEIIQKIASAVTPGGILVTYCAKGSVRRAFASAGFVMERIPGPSGKKEILRGKKGI
jgi:tRNA U34 5-methylaminomethyl-2-thiouridine-forming methyltransferase MnmC